MVVQDVEATVAVDHVPHQRGDLVGLGNVRRPGLALAALFLDDTGGLARGVQVQVDGDDGSAFPRIGHRRRLAIAPARSEEHTSELQSLMRISYAVFGLKKNTQKKHTK